MLCLCYFKRDFLFKHNANEFNGIPFIQWAVNCFVFFKYRLYVIFKHAHDRSYT